jgi:hypothetical protein
MTLLRYKEIKRKLALVVLVTLTIAFVIGAVVGVWQLVIRFAN